MTASFLRPHRDAVLLAIKVQPRAKRNEIGEALGDELKIKINAPPVDSAANEELIRFLAEKLGCSRSALQMVRGQSSRHKVISIHGLSTAEILNRLGMGEMPGR